MRMSVNVETWPLARPFKISRSEMTVSHPIVVELADGGYHGRGECEAHDVDIEIIGAAARELRALAAEIEKSGISHSRLTQLLPACPIRNALDCALWDLEAKQSHKPVWQLAGLTEPRPVTTVYTISVDDPAVMSHQAAGARHLPQLKVKLKGAGDLERLRAVRQAAPECGLIVDANEAWTMAQLREYAPACADLGVDLIEQPLPRGRDGELANYRSPVPLCADESCQDTSTLAEVRGKYQFINIKLDKTGGLTEALALLDQARASGLGIMVGCMVGTSLAMAPALLLAQYASFVDLDGPLLLKHDRSPALAYRSGVITPAPPALWG